MKEDTEKTAWTAIVRKPSYIIDDYPEPYHGLQVMADTAKQAGELAIIKAYKIDECEGRLPFDQGDYELVAVLCGLPEITWGWSMDAEPPAEPVYQILKQSECETYRCNCGNTKHDEGFFQVDEQGEYLSDMDTPVTDRLLYKCGRCDKIIEINEDSLDA